MVDEASIVGEKEEPGGIGIETSNGVDFGGDFCDLGKGWLVVFGINCRHGWSNVVFHAGDILVDGYSFVGMVVVAVLVVVVG